MADEDLQSIMDQAYPQKKYNDSPFDPDSHIDYPGYINGQTNNKQFTDEEWANRLPNDVKQMNDINGNIREGGDATPLDTLIAKMASGTASREEKMRFYNITGKPI